MLHILFNESDVQLLNEVIAMDESLSGPVHVIKDDFAVGPLTALDSEEGWQERLQWWKNMLKGSPYDEEHAGSFDDRTTVQQITSWLDNNPEQECWIWMAQNQHDVSGYFWLMPQLRNWQGRVMIIYLNNLPFLNDKGQLFYPSWLSEIPAKEFLKAKKLARPITVSEYEIDPDEWRKLVEENAVVRILEGGKKIVGKETDFYDVEIIKNTTGDWQKANRVLTNTLNRMKVKTGDIFLMSRVKYLIESGKFEVNGEVVKGWKDFDIKLAGVVSSSIPVSDN
ncbi:MAG: DUF1835 domain-containing protein [Chitinophagaceae bacterium]